MKYLPPTPHHNKKSSPAHTHSTGIGDESDRWHGIIRLSDVHCHPHPLILKLNAEGKPTPDQQSSRQTKQPPSHHQKQPTNPQVQTQSQVTDFAEALVSKQASKASKRNGVQLQTPLSSLLSSPSPYKSHMKPVNTLLTHASIYNLLTSSRHHEATKTSTLSAAGKQAPVPD